MACFACCGIGLIPVLFRGQSGAIVDLGLGGISSQTKVPALHPFAMVVVTLNCRALSPLISSVTFFWWAGLAVWPGACQGCRYVDQGTLFALLVKCFDPWYCESVVVFPSPQNGSHFGVSRSVSKAGVTLEGLLPVEPVGWGGLVGWIHQIM